MVKMGVFLAYKNYEIISVATGKVHVFKFHQRCLRANGRANFEYPTICNTDINFFSKYLLLGPPWLRHLNAVTFCVFWIERLTFLY